MRRHRNWSMLLPWIMSSWGEENDMVCRNYTVFSSASLPCLPPPVVRPPSGDSSSILQYFCRKLIWWFQTHEPCQSGLCVRECSLSRIVQIVCKKDNVASCGCGVLRSLGTTAKNCNAWFKGKNMLKDCNGEGWGRKRHGKEQYCKFCRNLNDRRTSICFLLCEGEITWDVSNLTKTKRRGQSRLFQKR